MTVGERSLDPADPLGHMLVRHAFEAGRAPALKDDTEALTYSELLEAVGRTASGLLALGVRPGDRVALRLPNSVAFVVASLGAMWLGAAFVPVSGEDPPARVERILRSCAPTVVLHARDDPCAGLGDLPWVEAETVPSRGTSHVERARDPDRDGYMIYTSGTSGAPKGVRIPARAFGYAIDAIAAALGIGPTTRTLCVSSFHFDGSYSALFPTLLAGGLAVIPRREELLFVKRFFSATLDHGITHSSFSPSFLRMLLASPRFRDLAGSDLRTIGLGGEECLAHDLARLWDVLPHLRVFNYYGPTESTIAASVQEVDRSCVETGKVPLGYPLPGVSFHLVDRTGRILDEPGSEGELYIGGRQLMTGYWRDEALTAQTLRADVLPGQVLYRTGDVAQRDAEGRYVYVGRCDDVVKRWGVRTSLEEIANALRQVDGVVSAACIPVNLEERLGVASFVEAAPGIDSMYVRRSLSEQLSPAMLPDEIFVVPSLPINGAGKVDRRALAASAGRRLWQDH